MVACASLQQTSSKPSEEIRPWFYPFSWVHLETATRNTASGIGVRPSPGAEMSDIKAAPDSKQRYRVGGYCCVRGRTHYARCSVKMHVVFLRQKLCAL